MPVKGSLLVDFVKTALNCQIYPQTFYWHSKEDKTFFLHCQHEKNKSCLHEQLKIFEDWDSAKPRKTKVKGNAKKRQRFIQALKKSEYFKLLKDHSTKSRKMFKFTQEATLSTNIDVLSTLVAELENESSPSSFNEPTVAGDVITFCKEEVQNNMNEDIDATMYWNAVVENIIQDERKDLNVHENQMNGSLSGMQDLIQVCCIQPVRLDGCKLDFISDEEVNQDKSVKYMISLKLH